MAVTALSQAGGLLAVHGVMPQGSDGKGAPGLLPPAQEPW